MNLRWTFLASFLWPSWQPPAFSSSLVGMKWLSVQRALCWVPLQEEEFLRQEEMFTKFSFPPRMSQTPIKISWRVYQHLAIVKPAGSDQNPAREDKKTVESQVSIFSPEISIPTHFSRLLTNIKSIHVSLPKINHQSPYSWNKSTSFNTYTSVSLSEFILIYLNFCQTDYSFKSPEGITENIHYTLLLGTHL